jgi:UDP-glucose 4-epimerase
VKIVVTGGAGFLGAATIVEATGRGHDAWRFDRADGDDVLGDLDGLGGAQAVIHLAGLLGTHELFDRPEEAVNVNIVGSLRVMQWCIENDATYVGITMPDVFPSIYTATKVATTRLATALHHSRGLRCAHVRAFNAYGPGQKYGLNHPQKIMPTFATKAWQGKALPVWGDGSQTVDLIHANDLARMLVDATKFTNNEVFDGGTGVPVSVATLASFVLEVTGSDAGIERLPMRDGETPTKIVAQGEGWDLLGWQPALNWAQLAHTVISYKP